MKSPVVIRIAGTAVLLLLMFGSLTAQTRSNARSNAWINGTWEGTGYQTDDQSTWTMLFTARGRKFSIDYPSLKCGGRWQLVSINANRARFTERLDHGQADCTDNGSVVIQRLSRNQLVFLYRIAGKREVTATAVLNRKRQKAVGSRRKQHPIFPGGSLMLRGHRDLKVYQLSYKLAMEIFHLSKAFPARGNLFSH